MGLSSLRFLDDVLACDVDAFERDSERVEVLFYGVEDRYCTFISLFFTYHRYFHSVIECHNE